MSRGDSNDDSIKVIHEEPLESEVRSEDWKDRKIRAELGTVPLAYKMRNTSVLNYIWGSVFTVGGIMGFARARSIPSLVAGVGAGVAYNFLGYEIDEAHKAGDQNKIMSWHGATLATSIGLYFMTRGRVKAAIAAQKSGAALWAPLVTAGSASLAAAIESVQIINAIWMANNQAKLEQEQLMGRRKD